jgi:hypothetical protein
MAQISTKPTTAKETREFIEASEMFIYWNHNQDFVKTATAAPSLHCHIAL